MVKKTSFSLSFLLIIALLMTSKMTIIASETIKFDNFKYIGQVENKNVNDPYFIMEIAPNVLDKMNTSLHDLRLYAGKDELNYARLPVELPEQPIFKKRVLSIINKGTLENQSYSFVMEVPKYNYKNTFLSVELDNQPYLVKGNLYGSEDNRNWTKLKAITIYKIENEISQIPLNHIDYPFLRIDFKQPINEQLKVKEAFLTESEKESKSEVGHIRTYSFEIEQLEQSHETKVIIDLGYKNVPTTQWEIGTNDKGFYRQVIVEGSQNKSDWSILGSTYIYNNPDNTESKLMGKYSLANYRYIQLRIQNENNQPIKINNIKMKAYPVRLLVKNPEQNAQSIMVYWGDEKLITPSYDIINFVDDLNIENLPTVLLKKAIVNPNYKEKMDQIPYTEKYPFLLPIGLIIATAIIALLLYRNIRNIKDGT